MSFSTPSASGDGDPRTPYGLRDLDAISPCTRDDPCVLDRMILEEFVAARGARKKGVTLR